MTYFVVSGETREGPYDVAGLTQLAFAGELQSNTVLEDEQGKRLQAAEVAGVIGPSGAIGPSAYFRERPEIRRRPGDWELMACFVLALIGPFMPCVHPLTFYYAYNARRQRNEGAIVAFALATFSVLVSVWMAIKATGLLR